MESLIDLTDRLARKHGSLNINLLTLNENIEKKERNRGENFDCFFVFTLSFSIFTLLLEPLWITTFYNMF
jgi:hypothetical protein